MPRDSSQSAKNHARIVPLYHLVAGPIFFANFFWSAYRAIRQPSGPTIFALLLAIAFIILFFFARVFALTVQDRIIRLEMRLRMRELLPTDLQPRINEFTAGQLVALRFASDGELPALARQVLEQRMNNRKAIKQLVKEWQADHLRA
ncbi:MAG TPA: DUF6526 family protein [Vicinamibacterales bacterium]|jgi:hypothetical protein|nr:DUF6526 family protein [Vicinamibacterales bacterium]